MNIDYLEEVKNGLPLKKVPIEFQTSSVCQMAISIDPTAIEYVPNNLLTEVADGEELINEVRRRRQAQLECEANVFEGPFKELVHGEFDRDAYIEEGMERLEEKIYKYYNEYKDASRVK